jgi:hypothetical protein
VLTVLEALCKRKDDGAREDEREEDGRVLEGTRAVSAADKEEEE